MARAVRKTTKKSMKRRVRVIRLVYLHLGSRFAEMNATFLHDSQRDLAHGIHFIHRSPIVERSLQVSFELRVHILGDQCCQHHKRRFPWRQDV